MAGRKPLPTNLKLLRGTAKNHRLNENEPQPDLEIPDPPEHLSEGAMNEWDRITVELDNIGLLSQIDRTALAAYCQVYGRWIEAEKAIETEGLITKTTNGNIIQNPNVGIANKALLLMHRFLTEFGMTPASRSKVSTKKKKSEKKSAWEKLNNG